jgi:hypothetical protein
MPLLGLWLALRVSSFRVPAHTRRAWVVYTTGFNLLAAFTSTALLAILENARGFLSFHLEFVVVIALTIGGIAHWIEPQT